MTRKQKRFALYGGLVAVLVTAAMLIAWGLQSTFAFFVTPSEITPELVQSGRALRLGGLVAQGSCAKEGEGVLRFDVTDGAATVTARFKGIVPDLFREGQGVVTLGTLRPDGSFLASEVLAKHDETYMPKDVAEALRKSGQWKPESGQAPAAGSWNTMKPGQGSAPKGGG